MIDDQEELATWEMPYPGYDGGNEGFLPIVTGPDRWTPVS
jgi:hypothetical protein